MATASTRRRPLTWLQSSYSGTGGANCIEVAVRPGVIRIRDSKDTRIQPLGVTPEAWAEFVGRIVPPCPVTWFASSPATPPWRSPKSSACARSWPRSTPICVPRCCR
ncbi:DUF397 domain-containing protein [Streptomyces sp. NPDC017615]|uniref:DUF397 domain-containing protein n=1 Tax=Streptomyces sp. NPDC017615 TaxID=3365003 RepID=UPI0037B00192